MGKLESLDGLDTRPAEARCQERLAAWELWGLAPGHKYNTTTLMRVRRAAVNSVVARRPRRPGTPKLLSRIVLESLCSGEGRCQSLRSANRHKTKRRRRRTGKPLARAIPTPVCTARMTADHNFTAGHNFGFTWPAD